MAVSSKNNQELKSDGNELPDNFLQNEFLMLYYY
jgi:hypothetical protein